MGNASSAGKRPPAPSISARDRAILDLKVQRDRLKQYQKKIVVILEREMEIAKSHLKEGNKPLALLALKKKKYQESLLESTSSQLLNLEQLTSTIEFTQVEQQVVQGLKQGNAVLSQLQAELSLDDVEKLMADTAEAIAYQNEISTALSGRLTEEDEDELEGELAALQDQVVSTMMDAMPSAPSHIPEPMHAIENPQLESDKHSTPTSEEEERHAELAA